MLSGQFWPFVTYLEGQLPGTYFWAILILSGIWGVWEGTESFGLMPSICHYSAPGLHSVEKSYHNCCRQDLSHKRRDQKWTQITTWTCRALAFHSLFFWCKKTPTRSRDFSFCRTPRPRESVNDYLFFPICLARQKFPCTVKVALEKSIACLF